MGAPEVLARAQRVFGVSRRGWMLVLVACYRSYLGQPGINGSLTDIRHIVEETNF